MLFLNSLNKVNLFYTDARIMNLGDLPRSPQSGLNI